MVDFITICSINEQIKKFKTSSDDFEILRTIKNQPDLTQRDIAKNLKLSLGKVNYCIQSLKEKGLIKINNFKKSK